MKNDEELRWTIIIARGLKKKRCRSIEHEKKKTLSHKEIWRNQEKFQKGDMTLETYT